MVCTDNFYVNDSVWRRMEFSINFSSLKGLIEAIKNYNK